MNPKTSENIYKEKPIVMPLKKRKIKLRKYKGTKKEVAIKIKNNRKCVKILLILLASNNSFKLLKLFRTSFLKIVSCLNPKIRPNIRPITKRLARNVTIALCFFKYFNILTHISILARKKIYAKIILIIKKVERRLI